MKIHRLSDMVRGWFIGDFQPTALRSSNFEVGIKIYAAGDKEIPHVHKVATELTVILSGEVEMNGERYERGAIITIEPGESADFKAITDVVTVVVKTPSVRDDKYSAL